MRVQTPGPGPLFPDDGPVPAQDRRRILGIIGRAARLRPDDRAFSADHAGRSRGRPDHVARPPQAVGLRAPAARSLDLPVRRDRGAGQAAVHLRADRRAVRAGLDHTSTLDLRAANPVGPQSPRCGADPVRDEVRGRRPRSHRQGSVHPDAAPRQHPRQPDRRRLHRAHLRNRGPVRDQAGDPRPAGDRHRRPLDPDRLHQARLTRPRHRDQGGPPADPRHESGRDPRHVPGGHPARPRRRSPGPRR